MCGIAGIIHRDGPGDIGAEMTRMLQSMKHRGPDSSGFALYGRPDDLFVMRIKLADPNEKRDFGWGDRLERHRNEIEHRLAKIGAMVDVIHSDQEYATASRSATPATSSRSPTSPPDRNSLPLSSTVPKASDRKDDMQPKSSAAPASLV